MTTFSKERHERSPSFEEIPSSRGRLFVIRDTAGYARRNKNVLVDPKETERNAPDGGGLGLMWERLKKGYEEKNIENTDYGRILVVRSGRLQVQVLNAEGLLEVEEVLGRDGIFIAGRGTQYSLKTIGHRDTEVLTAYAPGSFGMEDTDSKDHFTFIKDAWTFIKGGKEYEKRMYYAGHFIPPEEGAHSLHLEGKAQLCTQGNQLSWERTMPSTTQYGASFALFSFKGQYCLSFEVERGEWKDCVLKSGDGIYWDNRIPHVWHAIEESTKQFFFRAPSKQPNTTLLPHR